MSMWRVWICLSCRSPVTTPNLKHRYVVLFICSLNSYSCICVTAWIFRVHVAMHRAGLLRWYTHLWWARVQGMWGVEKFLIYCLILCSTVLFRHICKAAKVAVNLFICLSTLDHFSWSFILEGGGDVKIRQERYSLV
jgi:hypothetical protein